MFMNSKIINYLLLSILLLIGSKSLSAAELKGYIINKNGLDLYAQKDIRQSVVFHIPYGDSVSLIVDVDGVNAENKINIDSIEDNWYKVKYKGKSGYLSKAFVIPYPAPKLGTESLSNYMQSISRLETPKKTYQYKSVESDDFELTKEIYTNGMEVHHYDAYESNASTYFLPSMSVAQGFALMRLFKEYDLLNQFVGKFPQKNTEYIRNNEYNSPYDIAIEAKSTHFEVYYVHVVINTGGFFEFKFYYQNGVLIIEESNYI